MLKAIVYYREICYIDYILKRKLDSLLGTSQKGTLDSYVLIRDKGSIFYAYLTLPLFCLYNPKALRYSCMHVMGASNDYENKMKGKA